MRSKLIYFIAGLLLASTLAFGALALRAQASTYNGVKYEYALLTFSILGSPDPYTVIDVKVNGVDMKANGATMFDVFNAIGGQGWELSAAVGNGQFLFKRVLPGCVVNCGG